MQLLINDFELTHPIRVYLEENILTKDLLEKLSNCDITKDFETFYNIFNSLCEVELHYSRKENQLFPYIEKYGWDTTSQYMWTFHDQIRDDLKQIRENIDKRIFNKIEYMIEELTSNIHHLILLEETTLFPNSYESLNKDDWEEIKQGDEEIGDMLNSSYIHPKNDKVKKDIKIESDAISLDEGALTPLQVNMLFKNLPIDVTYVDENDKVVFYNKGDERIFPRSPGIIGREVRFCHPPKSVDTVLQILESFKDGSKDSAQFWINFKGSLIHIRFFAIRDEENIYRGVMEITQDVSDIKTLEGERRILDWKA